MINDINYNIKFTCDINPERRVCFAIIIFSSTFIIVLIFKHHLSNNQGVVFTKEHFILGPVDRRDLWITSQITLFWKCGVQCNGEISRLITNTGWNCKVSIWTKVTKLLLTQGGAVKSKHMNKNCKIRSQTPPSHMQKEKK